MKEAKKYPVLTLALVLIALIAVAVSRIGGNDTDELKNASKPVNDGNIIAHFLDVGQGDSAFIELPNGECMLIDASERECADAIIQSIEGYGYSKLDYVVATHPHADHIGGMSDVIEHFDIGEIYMPKASSNSKTFENLLTTISDKGLEINTAKAGKSIYSGSDLKIDILSPVYEKYDDLNNYSAVVKITYGVNSFLFTGDAEELAERQMLENSYDKLDCDVLKVAHHGSNSSSSYSFLEAVTPEYAVISCGKGNSYGHPHDEPLLRLSDIGAKVYETDIDGSVTITCDGNNNFKVDCD